MKHFLSGFYMLPSRYSLPFLLPSSIELSCFRGDSVIELLSAAAFEQFPDDAAVFKYQYTAGEARSVSVMGYHEYCSMQFPVGFLQRIQQFRSRIGIQRPRRLIGK